MKRKLALICALAFAPLMMMAQDRIVTPFTKRVTNEDGQKVYIKTQPTLSRRSISVGYGFMPASSINSIANQSLIYTSPGNGYRIEGNIGSTMGSVNFAFNYELTPWLEISIPIIYSKNWGVQPVYRSHYNEQIYVTEGYLRDNWFTLMPGARISWMRNSWLSLYSRASIGISLANRNRGIDNDMFSAPAFAYQFSPVGAEFGKAVCFYIEAGFGFTGVVTAGVKFKVGKVLQDGSSSNGRQVEWYEKYMKY